MVLEDDSDTLPFVGLYGRSRHTAVVSPGIDDAPRHKLGTHRLGHQAKLSGTIHHFPRQLGHVWSLDRKSRFADGFGFWLRTLLGRGSLRSLRSMVGVRILLRLRGLCA